eukprot:9731523-Alexandrium_andersonii.AAC.1
MPSTRTPAPGTRPRNHPTALRQPTRQVSDSQTAQLASRLLREQEQVPTYDMPPAKRLGATP